jgi:ribosome-associated protein
MRWRRRPRRNARRDFAHDWPTALSNASLAARQAVAVQTGAGLGVARPTSRPSATKSYPNWKAARKGGFLFVFPYGLSVRNNSGSIDPARWRRPQLNFPRFCAIYTLRLAERRGIWRNDTLLTATLAEAASPPLHPVPGRAPLETGPLVQTVLTCLDDSKAENIVAIDLHGKTILADTMIIASGRSNVHVGAIAERVIGAFKGKHHKPPRVEGLRNCEWVLVDGTDIIVHIFRPEVRQFYNLEKMWSLDRPGERCAG